MNLTDNINSFFGIDKGGNCLCGPYLPFSIARPGPDTTIPQAASGYRSGDRIIRFSQNHVSGTGGGGRYGNIGITPYVNKEDCLNGYQPEAEQAKPGYYFVKFLDGGIKAELTSTARVCLHRYNFSEHNSAGILLDLGAIINTGSDLDKMPLSIGGQLEVVSENEIIGRADCKGGWGHNYPYSVYFSLQCDQPVKNYELESKADFQTEKNCCYGSDIKTWLDFGKVEAVEIRVGISYVSIAKARSSIKRETAGKTFEDIVNEADTIWNNQLKKIVVDGGKEEDKKLFYSAFYRLSCMPSDLGIDDENNLWESGVRQFSDFYCLWDSVRNANSLLMLIAPQLSIDMMNALLDIGKHTGWIPDAWIIGHSAQIQGGCSSDILFAEFAAKNVAGIDYKDALGQMLKTRCEKSPDPRLFGRYLEHYRDLGYVSTDTGNCVSRNIEYTYQDWCASKLAGMLGESELEAEFLEDSQKIWNLWRDDLKCFAPKTPNGTWVDPFDPWNPTRPDYWYDPYYYEGTAAEWSLCALHVIDEVIEKHGGKSAFTDHLDYFFENIFHWKEIILHTPYLYHLVDRPDKTAERVAEILRQKYHSGRDGLPDNDDMGAQSAFVICSMLGIYPIAGQTRYMLSTPYFEYAKIELGSPDKALIITTDNSQSTHPYVKSISFNGVVLENPWIEHEQICNGGNIHFTLSKSPVVK